MRLILVGFGTVGRGTVECLRGAESAFAAAGAEPRLVAVVDPVVGSVWRDEGLDLAELLRCADEGEPLSGHPGAVPVGDLAEVLERAAADVLIEVTPTDLESGEPGLGHIRAALDAGLHVVTTNKGPIALAHADLDARARAAGVALRFEGTVMSGTPVLNLAAAGLADAGIRSLRGVVNGTCNYILSQMEGGAGYREALAEAQAKGYAEADPSGDVEGWDAAAKALILANCLLGANLALADVDRRGISSLGPDDVGAAAAQGKVWRLVARVDPTPEGWKASVAPEVVDCNDPIGALTGPGNLLVFDTEALGEVTISGPGAGRRETGHAVVADLVAIHRAFR